MNALLLLAPSGVNILSILIAICVLLFMVTVHEFGHYVAGKKLGFKINEFSIGFGPCLFKKMRKSGEQFSIRAFPLGGYCAFEGEDEESDSPDAFEKKEPWKRIIVLVAGAFMNFVSTVLIVVLTFAIGGQYLLKVNEVLPSSIGETVSKEYMLQKDDIILSVNGRDIYLTTELTSELVKANKTPEKPISVTVIRDGEKKDVSVFLRNYVFAYEENGETVTKESKGLGITQGSAEVKFGFFESIGRSFIYCFKMAGSIFTFLGELFTGKIGLDSLSGPVSTITITAEVASYGFRQLLEIVALIGVNLAVFNLLPIPALDGSKIVFTIIEWIRKKPINKKVEAIIHLCGFIFLIGFAILVDVLKYI